MQKLFNVWESDFVSKGFLLYEVLTTYNFLLSLQAGVERPHAEERGIDNSIRFD